MSRICLYLFGNPRVDFEGDTVKFDSRKAHGLFFFLAVTGERHSRDQLVNLLWPESDRSHGRALLRSALHSLRKTLPDNLLESDKENLGIDQSRDISADVNKFGSLLAMRAAHDHPAAEICLSCLEPLKEAVDLYRGDFLSGFNANSINYEEWQFTLERHLRAEADTAYELLIRCLTESRNLDEAIQYAEKWLILDRANETAHRFLMHLFAKSGRRAAALHQYEECVRMLGEELQVTPDEETCELFERIKSDRIDVEKPSPTLDSKAPQSNLPVPLTSFVGREREKSDVKRLLPTTRLFTLTGAGGCGKTRLAIEVATEVADEYADGVRYVELALVTDITQITHAVAATLNVREWSPQTVIEAVKDYLVSKQMLLLLDNCEHLSDGCADIVDNLLQTCKELRILVTSRESLNISGEITWRIPSLSSPPVTGLDRIEHADLMRYEAVCLFTERASALLPGFAITAETSKTIARICSLLDGIPLALELAAGKLTVLSAEQLAEKLEKSFHILSSQSRLTLPRHQTLLATIEWSYRLLTAKEQTLLRRLSVFVGGFELDAAEQICADKKTKRMRIALRSSEMLDILSRLVDKSLVLFEGKRYRLLETIRQFGLIKLADKNELLPVQTRHRNWYLEFAETTEPKLTCRGQILWMENLDREMGNIRAAIEFSVLCNDGEEARRIAGSLWWYWMVRDRYSEGLEQLTTAFSANGKISAPVRAKAFLAQGTLSYFSGDTETTKAYSSKCILLYEHIRDKRVAAWSLMLRWVLVSGNSSREQHESYSQRVVSIGREQKDPWIIINGLRILGVSRVMYGKPSEAIPFFEEALVLCRELGDLVNLNWLVFDLAGALQMKGEYDRAAVLLEEALGIAQRLHHGFGETQAMRRLGEVAQHQCDFKKARKLLLKALAKSNEIGSIRRFACYNSLANLEVAEKQHERAAMLFGAANKILKRESMYEAVRSNIAKLRKQMGEETFANFWNNGMSMTDDEAMKYAFSEV